MINYDSIIFDLDGTIWDSTEAAAKVWAEVAKEHGVGDKVTKERLKELYGLPLEEIATGLFPNSSKEIAISIMEESVVRQCPVLAKQGGILLGNVVDTLERLKENYALLIVSNCRSGYIEAFLKAHELQSYFIDFECPGRTGKLKADNIRIVMERNLLKNPVYVGDTSGDGRAAKEAGIPFIYARYGFGDAAEYDNVIDSFEELLQLLKEVNK